MELLASREPIDDVLKKNNLDSRERQKIIFSKNVLDFAKSAGLHVEGSYQKYVKLDGDAVSYTVQAAKPTEMQLKRWWFPVVGSVPYLGFFNRDERDDEVRELESKGYETHKGSVAAYSSLGWFSDPIYSSMLRRSDPELAHLYFHELTHRTIWLNGGVEFNENLAEFVADHLTAEFFVAIGRKNELAELEVSRQDFNLFKSWLEGLRVALKKNLEDSLGQPELDRIKSKNKVIMLAISKKPAFKRFDFVGNAPWNNARILAAGLYSPDTAAFERAAACFGKDKSGRWTGNFLKALEKLAETLGDGFLALNAMCAR